MSCLDVDRFLDVELLEFNRFITIYKSSYEFICLESYANIEINLDPSVSNIPRSFAAEGQTNQIEI